MHHKFKSVLLIDDDEIVHFILSRLFRTSGLCGNIEKVTDGEEAIAFMNQSPQADPELILVDVNMPGMNGFDFLDAYAKLPAERKKKHTVIMLTTAENQMDRKKASTYPDLTAYLAKPLTEATFHTLADLHF